MENDRVVLVGKIRDAVREVLGINPCFALALATLGDDILGALLSGGRLGVSLGCSSTAEGSYTGAWLDVDAIRSWMRKCSWGGRAEI